MIATSIRLGLACALAGFIAVNAQAEHRASDVEIRIAGLGGDAASAVEGFNTLYRQTYPGTRLSLVRSGNAGVVSLLMFERALLGVMDRPLAPLEQVPMRKIAGRDVLSVRVAEATAGHASRPAVHVHADNPVTRLTARQVERMLTVGNPGGDYSRWGQLGLDGDWARRSIHPYGPSEYSDAGGDLQRRRLHGRPFAPTYETVEPDRLADRVSTDPAGIAILALDAPHPGLKRLEVVADDDDARPVSYARALYIHVRREPGKPLDPVARDYLRLVLSPEGQRTLDSRQRGYRALSADDARSELRRLD
ncbi:MAG: hypothetical protein QM766_20660 [Burkholderiaceae bacterium]